MPALIKQPLVLSLAFSVTLHAFALFGIHFTLPDPRKAMNSMQSLQVVLVNAKSSSSPAHADALAQNNLDGGGNTTEDLFAKSPLPTLRDDTQFTPEQSARRIRQLEQEARRLMTRNKSTYSVAQERRPRQEVNKNSNDEDLVQRSLEIARLEAQIDKDFKAYEKMPRRTFIGARTREYRFAQYAEAWRRKVEEWGTLNYPEEIKGKGIHAHIRLTVSIRADGSLESVEINRSSGKPILDAAAIHIIKLASPFAPLPPNIRRDTDILSITRTVTFTQAGKLQSE